MMESDCVAGLCSKDAFETVLGDDLPAISMICVVSWCPEEDLSPSNPHLGTILKEHRKACVLGVP
jgi:hypothetical protein